MKCDRGNRFKLVENASSDECEEENNDNEAEYLCCQSALHKIMAASHIFDEQDRQAKEGISDQEAIARIYKDYSYRCRRATFFSKLAIQEERRIRESRQRKRNLPSSEPHAFSKSAPPLYEVNVPSILKSKPIGDDNQDEANSDLSTAYICAPDMNSTSCNNLKVLKDHNQVDVLGDSREVCIGGSESAYVLDPFCKSTSRTLCEDETHTSQQ